MSPDKKHDHAPTPLRRTRGEKKAATREALLDAARRVFARQGYVATSVDEVAWEAGMTKGAVYSNFASKDELFAAVIERHQDERQLAIARSVDRTAPLLEQATRAGEQFMASRDRDFELLTLEYTLHAARFPEGHEAMRERQRRMKAAIGEVIQETGPDDPVTSVLPIDQLVMAFFAIGDGVSVQWLAAPEDVPDDLYTNVLAIFVRGLEATAEDRAKEQRRTPRRRTTRAS